MFTMRCGCPCWVEQRFCWCEFQFLILPMGLGLAAAVNAVVLILKLARMDILTLRVVPILGSPLCLGGWR
jgi:hypothetical protein